MNKILLGAGLIASAIFYATPSYALTVSDADSIGYAYGQKVCEAISKHKPDSQHEALLQALKLLPQNRLQELILLLDTQSQYGTEHTIVKAFQRRLIQTIRDNCMEEYARLDGQSAVSSREDTSYSATANTCGSVANTFGSTVYIVYLSPEREGDARYYGCNDAFVVTVNQRQWLQVASFNNEQDARELANKISGWYAKKTIDVLQN